MIEGEGETKVEVSKERESLPNMKSGQRKVKSTANSDGRPTTLTSVSESELDKIPVKKRSWIPTDEEKDKLYGHRSFLIESDEAGKSPLAVVLWRIWDQQIPMMCQMFLPVDLNGRHIHFATKEFVKLQRDKLFYSKYQPVYVMTVIDTAETQVVQYFNIERILPCLLQIRNGSDTSDLFLAMKVVVQAIMLELMRPNGFIERAVLLKSTECEEYYRTNWEYLSSALSSRANAIIRKYNISAKSVAAFRKYPVMTIKKQRDKSKRDCTVCGCETKTGTCRANFPLKPYDPYNFKELGRHDTRTNEIMICYSCQSRCRILHRLFHHKWRIHAAIGTHLTNLKEELGPDEVCDSFQVIKNLLIDDFEWCAKSFVELQVVLVEADNDIKKKKMGK